MFVLSSVQCLDLFHALFTVRETRTSAVVAVTDVANVVPCLILSLAIDGFLTSSWIFFFSSSFGISCKLSNHWYQLMRQLCDLQQPGLFYWSANALALNSTMTATLPSVTTTTVSGNYCAAFPASGVNLAKHSQLVTARQLLANRHRRRLFLYTYEKAPSYVLA